MTEEKYQTSNRGLYHSSVTQPPSNDINERSSDSLHQLHYKWGGTSLELLHDCSQAIPGKATKIANPDKSEVHAHSEISVAVMLRKLEKVD